MAGHVTCYAGLRRRACWEPELHQSGSCMLLLARVASQLIAHWCYPRLWVYSECTSIEVSRCSASTTSSSKVSKAAIAQVSSQNMGQPLQDVRPAGVDASCPSPLQAAAFAAVSGLQLICKKQAAADGSGQTVVTFCHPYSIRSQLPCGIQMRLVSGQHSTGPACM